jgi:hypothetical protein
MAGKRKQSDEKPPARAPEVQALTGNQAEPVAVGGIERTEGHEDRDILPSTAEDSKLEFWVSKAIEGASDLTPSFAAHQLKRLEVNLEREKAQLEHKEQESAAAIQLEIAKLEYNQAVSRTEAERELTARVYRTRGRVTSIEAWLRAALAGALVAGTIAVVIVGIFKGTNPQELAQYLAPITGLTGLAVGYVFGAQSAADRAGFPSPEPAFTVTPDEKIQRTA